MVLKWAYMRVKLPDELVGRVEKLAEKNGYNGVTDFVREATRLRADELEQLDG